ncbi:unnamed protein product, partial [marine sediment metagenome]
KDKGYQFNEHFEKWKNLSKRQVLKNDKKLIKLTSKTYQIDKENLPKRQILLVKKTNLGMPNNQGKGIKNKDIRGGEHTSKETLKENKETPKERNFLNNKIPEKKHKLSREQIELNKRCVTKFGKFLKGLKRRRNE